jgi:hypothetical protein
MWCPNQECPDLEESGSPAEFVEGRLTCTFCGADLVPDRPAWADEKAAEIRLAPVMPILDASWLPRVKSILDAAGVRFRLEDASVRRRNTWSGAAPGLGSTAGAPLVMVEEGDLERATALLGDLTAEFGLNPGDAPPELAAPAWQPSSCPQCRNALESSEGDEPLAYCYHCGASLAPEAADR